MTPEPNACEELARAADAIATEHPDWPAASSWSSWGSAWLASAAGRSRCWAC